MALKDIQNLLPVHKILINQVGITQLHYPIIILDRANIKQHTIGIITASISLPQQFKGTHMSRFIEVLNDHRGEVTMRTFPAILSDLKRRFKADSARIEVQFPYFLERSAPETGSTGLMDYNCTFIGEESGDAYDFVLSVEVPVTSLCPCSKAISDYGAHNQRGLFRIEIRTRREENGELAFLWIEDLIDIAESSGSTQVFPLLKRADERHLTMKAYDNPVFVEDMVRNVAVQLQEDERVSWFRVKAENHESIHNHNTFAEIENRK